MGAIPRNRPGREAARESSMWDMYAATGRWDEAENLRPGSTWLAGIVRHDTVVHALPSSIRRDFLGPRAARPTIDTIVLPPGAQTIWVGDPPQLVITSDGIQRAEEWEPWIEHESIRAAGHRTWMTTERVR